MAGTEQDTEGLSESREEQKERRDTFRNFSEGVAGMRTGLNPLGKMLTVI